MSKKSGKSTNESSTCTRPHAIVFTQLSLARNSFKEECDVSKIVEKFARTGVVSHVRKGEGSFADAPEMDFREAMALRAELDSRIEHHNAFGAPEAPESVTETEADQKVAEVEKEAQGAVEKVPSEDAEGP